jgi:SAM-dependent methyltransferase
VSWDRTWEAVFKSRSWGRYPPEELVRFVARNFFNVRDRKLVRILELGSGPGANVWFLAREGFDVYGIDGSPTALEQARKRLKQEGLETTLTLGDIVDLRNHYPTRHFDAVVDVACLQCNDIHSVKSILESALDILKPDGKLFSMMVDTESYGYGMGRQIEPGTLVDITEGPYAGIGRCHFFSLEEVRSLFSLFCEVRIERSIRSVDDMNHWIGHWVVEAVKSHEVALA